VMDLRDELDGYTVSFTSVLEDIDATPLMKGLPEDRCQCPHWGYVFKGKMTARYADRDEVFEVGDAFYAARPRPGGERARHRDLVVQSQRRAAHGRGGHDEEHAGDAEWLNALGEEARGKDQVTPGLFSITRNTTARSAAIGSGQEEKSWSPGQLPVDSTISPPVPPAVSGFRT
jgi:hypothetical protein